MQPLKELFESEEDRQLRGLQEAADAARERNLKSILGGGLEKLVEGDQVTVTAGKQTFNPAKYCSFEAGPVTVCVTVTAQGAVEAYARASAAAQQMLETEYQIAKQLMDRRLKETER